MNKIRGLHFNSIIFIFLTAVFSFSGNPERDLENKSENLKPNIILCMADDLGWGDVGYNGNQDIKTPNLDKMAREGVRFDRFYAGSSVCSPTRGSCLSGRHPYRYGIFSANVGHLKDEEICLAEILKKEGYATAHFGKWHLGTLTPDFSGKGTKREPAKNYMTPGMQGFDEWFSTEFAIPTYDPYASLDNGKKRDVRSLYWENGVNITGGLTGDDSKIIMDKAIPFIEKNVKAHTLFFAVIWFHAPHQPVIGDPKVMKKYYSAYPEDQQHYYSVVTSLDAQMGRLRKELKDLGIAGNTVLCFTSDNGPEGNPGKKGRSQGSAGSFRGRKRSLYEGGIREPSIIEYPSVFGKGVIKTACSTSDYFPTVCDLLGYKVKDNRPYDGISFLPIIESKQQLRNHPIGFQWGQQKALTDDRYKLVHNLSSVRPKSDNGTVPLAEYELYDLIKDPYETQNIADQHPEIVEKMKKQLAEWVASCERSLEGDDYKK